MRRELEAYHEDLADKGLRPDDTEVTVGIDWKAQYTAPNVLPTPHIAGNVRFAHERYTQSRLYAGERPKIVIEGHRSHGGIVLDDDIGEASEDRRDAS